MLRFGNISEFDAEKMVARVDFDDDDIVSDWLRVSVVNSLKTKDEVFFDVGEPVWCIMDSDSGDGVIAGSYYNDDNLPVVKDPNKRSVTFQGGTTVSYDKQSNLLEINCSGDVKIICQNATIEAQTKVSLNVPNAEISGNLKVSGNVSSDGNIKALGIVQALAGTPFQVSLSTHVHSGSGVPPTPNT